MSWPVKAGAAVLAVLVLAGLHLATLYRAGVPGELGVFGSGGAWVGLWIVGGGLALALLAVTLDGLVGEGEGLQLRLAAGPVVLATAVAAGVSGFGTGLLALPLLAFGFGVLVHRELPGWGGVGAVVLALVPGLLADANATWVLASAFGVLALIPWGSPGSPRARETALSLTLGIVAGLLDPLVGLGLAAFLAVDRRHAVAGVPAVAAIWPLSQQLDPTDPVLAPALGLAQVAVALGWPFALLGLLAASPRWQAMAAAMALGTALVGPTHAGPLIVPVAAGCLVGSVDQLGRSRALVLWIATVLVVTIGYTPKMLQLTDPGSMLTREEEER